MKFSLLFFSSGEEPLDRDKYWHIIESCKFADANGLEAVWVPERHFNVVGCLYPNPAVLHAAIARETKHIRLRAGSVVLPLHNPLRVAEEWSIVDNLSNGRVEIACASGWSADDFVFFPELYSRRRTELFNAISTIRQLWRGETIETINGIGEPIKVRIYPTPLQPELPIWTTTAGNPETFIQAGLANTDLLTHLFDQDVEHLGEKVVQYRAARQREGHLSEPGRVAVMLHTFLGADLDTVHEQARGPYCDYLRSGASMLQALVHNRNPDLKVMSLEESELESLVHHAYDKLVAGRSFIGTPESCKETVRALQDIGVDEIACLLDFGIDRELVVENLPRLMELVDLVNNSQPATSFYTRSNPEPLPHLQATAETTGLDALAVGSCLELETIKRRCASTIDSETFYQELEKRCITIGSGLRGLSRVWFRHRESLAEVELPYDPSASMNSTNYVIGHPALLDACLQTVAAALWDEESSEDKSNFYVPCELESFQLCGAIGPKVWSHALIHADGDLGQQVHADVRVLDQNGVVVAEITNLRLSRSSVQQSMPDVPDSVRNWIYEIEWVKSPVAQATNVRVANWLVFADQHGLGKQLAALLEARGQRCVVVNSNKRPGSATENALVRVLGDADAADWPVWNILYLAGLDFPSVERLTPDSLWNEAVPTLDEIVSIISTLMLNAKKGAHRLFLVTRGGQYLEGASNATDAVQSLLWGLGRSSSIEAPDIWGGLIDLDPEAGIDNCAEQLLEIFDTDNGFGELALRCGQIHRSRLTRPNDFPGTRQWFDPDGAYLITGGLWGMGFETARWLARLGAKHLLLLGLTRLPSPGQINLNVSPDIAVRLDRIQEIESLGARVHYGCVDIADRSQVAEFLDRYRSAGGPPIVGAIHSASSWRDENGRSIVHTIDRLSFDRSRMVLGTKVLGATVLRELLEDEPLNFFCLFSSGASLLGSDGLANYAAANAFLDGFAHYLRFKGVPAIVINWGTVSHIGFGATSEGRRLHEYLESRGLLRLAPTEVLEALNLVLGGQAPQVGVIKIDWPVFAEAYPQLAELPTYRAFIRNEAQLGTNTPPSVLQQVQTMQDAADRRSFLRSYLHRKIAQALRADIEDVPLHDPLVGLGVDSLIAIGLKNTIESDLRASIPVIKFLKGASIEQIAEELAANTLLQQVAAPSTNMHPPDLPSDSVEVEL